MPGQFIIRQDEDRTWSVLVVATGLPVRLAGIPQSGLSLIEAEITLDLLAPSLSSGTPDAVSRPLAFPECATAA